MNTSINFSTFLNLPAKKDKKNTSCSAWTIESSDISAINTEENNIKRTSYFEGPEGPEGKMMDSNLT